MKAANMIRCIWDFLNIVLSQHLVQAHLHKVAAVIMKTRITLTFEATFEGGKCCLELTCLSDLQGSNIHSWLRQINTWVISKQLKNFLT